MSAGPSPDRTAASSRAEVPLLTATASVQPVKAARSPARPGPGPPVPVARGTGVPPAETGRPVVKAAVPFSKNCFCQW
jgi:hypothetical protein